MNNMRNTLLLLCFLTTLCSAGVQFPSRSGFRRAIHQPPLQHDYHTIQRRTSGFNYPSLRAPLERSQNSPESSHTNVFRRRDTEQLTTETRGIVFPGPWKVETTTEDVQLVQTPSELTSRLVANEHQNCSVQNYTVFYPSTGKCEKLLERGPCGDDQWLVVRPPLNHPVCSYRPCVRGFANSRRNNCTSEVRCHFDRAPFATPEGEVLCFCMAGTVLWKEDGRCYRLFRKGPCPANSHLILDAFDEPVCITNPCIRENTALFQAPVTESTTTGNKSYLGCYELGTRGPCQENYIFELDFRTLKPGCVSAEFALDIRQLLRTASFRCPSGTYRSYSGSCNRGFAVKDFRTAFFG